MRVYLGGASMTNQIAHTQGKLREARERLEAALSAMYQAEAAYEVLKKDGNIRRNTP